MPAPLIGSNLFSVYNIMPVEVQIKKSTKDDKKLMALFFEPGEKTPFKTTHFGNKGSEDYTNHGNKQKRTAYLKRHEATENWNDYKSAGSLSKHINWGPTPNRDPNIKAYVKKFNLKLRN